MSHDRISRRGFLQASSITGSAIAAAAVSQSADEPMKDPMLAELDRTPEEAKLPLMMRWLKERPLPLFEELRRSRPFLKVSDVVFVARYADVVEVLSHPTIFSVKLYRPKMGDFMLALDETPINRRDKGVMSAMLPQSDATLIRNLVAGFAKEALAKAGGRIDIVERLSRTVPLRVVQQYCGLDGVDIGDLKKWSYWAQYDNFYNHHFHARPNAAEISAQALQAKNDLKNYAVALFARRLQQLKTEPNLDDIVSRMIRSQLPPSTGFTAERVVANIMGLLIGAVETTSQAIVQIIDELLRRPKEMARAAQLAAAGKIEEFDAYVWEASRFSPLSPFLFRWCEQDFTVAKGTERATRIASGATVLALIQSAAFDPTEFEKPMEFRLDRPGYQNFLFGFGHHRCLGELAGRTMISETVRTLVALDKLERAAGAAGQIDFRNGPFPESMTLTYKV